MKKSDVTIELIMEDDPAKLQSEADRKYIPLRARYVYRKGYHEDLTIVRHRDGRWWHTPWAIRHSFATQHEAVDAALDSFSRSIKMFRESKKRR